MQHTKKDPQKRVLTIPNLLSLFRIILLPLFVWLYVFRQCYLAAGGVLILSGVTDIADGVIARKFHMVSDLGKVLDPVADKVTQGVVLLCLMVRYPWMAVPLVLLLCKELCMAVTGGLVIYRSGQVYSAAWHGKLATVFLDVMLVAHLVWLQMPDFVSILMAAAASVLILLSFVLYLRRNMQLLRGTGKDKQRSEHTEEKV